MIIASLDGFYDIRFLTAESILFLMIRAKIVAEGNIKPLKNVFSSSESVS